jgi:hypothetical protein
MSDGADRITQTMLRDFMGQRICPRLPAEYVRFSKHDLVRMRGPFAQVIAASVGRSGVILKINNDNRRSKRVCASSSAGVGRLEDGRASVKAPCGCSVGLWWGR